MAGRGRNQIVVIIRGAGAKGRSLRYIRPFVGLTVEETIDRLNKGSRAQGGLPQSVWLKPPYWINREPEAVDRNSARVLKEGDTLSTDIR